MLFRQILIPSALIPLVVALAVAGVGILAWRRKPGEPASRNTLAGLALGAAFVGAFLAMTGLPRWFPIEASQRLFFLIGLASVWSVVAVSLERRAATLSGHTILWALALAGLLESPLRHSWSTTQAAVWLSGLAALAAFLSWSWARNLDHEDHDPAKALVRIAVLSGVALALGLSGTARMAQLCGALAAGVFAIEALGWWQGRSLWRPQQGIVPALGAAGLLLIGYFYAELAALPASLLLISIGLLGLRTAGWQWKALPLLPLAAAVAIVVVAFFSQPEDTYDYYTSVDLPSHPSAASPAPRS
jgi:hypothetical protein